MAAMKEWAAAVVMTPSLVGAALRGNVTVHIPST
jgi:hypothetical protein